MLPQADFFRQLVQHLVLDDGRFHVGHQELPWPRAARHQRHIEQMRAGPDDLAADGMSEGLGLLLARSLEGDRARFIGREPLRGGGRIAGQMLADVLYEAGREGRAGGRGDQDEGIVRHARCYSGCALSSSRT